MNVIMGSIPKVQMIRDVSSPCLRHPSRRRAVRLACVGALAAALAGCTADAPPGPRPLAAAAASFDAMSGAPVSADTPADAWWRLYDDPVLDQLVHDALAANLDLKVAAANVARARSLLAQADAARLPDTTLGFGVDYGKHAPDQIVAAARGQSAADSRWGYAPSFALSWEVDLWGRVRSLSAAARADADAARAASDAMRVTVAADTAAAYARVCAYGERIGVAERSLAVAERVAGLTGRQRARGLVSGMELARARSFADETRAALPALRGERQAALYELAVLTGRPPAAFPPAAARCVTTPALARPFPVGDGALLLRRRPDLRESEQRLAAARARVGVARAAQYPSIVLGGSVDLLSTTGSLASLGDPYALSWGVGPLIRWRFPNLAVSRAELGAARADSVAADAAFDARVLLALREVEQALAQYGAAWSRRSALAEAREAGARAFRLAELNYRAGALDFLDVLDAERSLVALDAELAASNQTVAADQVALFRALGGGWQAQP